MTRSIPILAAVIAQSLDASALLHALPVSKLSFIHAQTSRGLAGGLELRLAKDDGLTTDEREEKYDKALKAMTAFSNSYIKNTDTKFCEEKSIAAVVIKGLAEHKVSLGAPLCPCRFYEDKEKEVKDGYWNCPCVPMRERKECHCMLFLTDENPFAGEETVSSIEFVLISLRHAVATSFDAKECLPSRSYLFFSVSHAGTIFGRSERPDQKYRGIGR